MIPNASQYHLFHGESFKNHTSCVRYVVINNDLLTKKIHNDDGVITCLRLSAWNKRRSNWNFS